MGKADETRERILAAAMELYLTHGVEPVTIRMIAREAGLSHSNLIYHFKTVEEILFALHEKLLTRALELNRQNLGTASPLETLHKITESGFPILLDFSFFLLDMVPIVRRSPELKQRLMEVEKIRGEMYRGMIEELVSKGLMRKEDYPGEYLFLIERIRIFSDSWIPSTFIYGDLKDRQTVKRNVHLLMDHFYPYLTTKGKKQYRALPL